jgi:urease accessory protein UreH
MIAASLDRRPAAGVGRLARLELTFEVARGRTVLTHAYAEPPYRVGRCFQEGPALHLIMASSAPGVFGGDRFEQSVRVCRGAQVRLTSQSSLQLHPACDDAGAELVAEYEVDDGASLSCHWDPLIPFAGARFEQRLTVRAAAGASVYWSDAFTSGRFASGEHWRFDSLAHEFRLLRSGSLDYLERYRISPAHRPVTGEWAAGRSSCFGTTLVACEALAADAASQAHEELGTVGGCDAAVDACDDHLVIARLMASSSVPFRRARELLAHRFQRQAVGSAR